MTDTVNRGKQFESEIMTQFSACPGVSIDRLHDQTTGYAGSSNICDFIIYKRPNEYYLECKSVHKNTLSIYSSNPKKKYGKISNTQWEGMIEKAKIDGVYAGVLCWFIDHDKTVYIPAENLEILRSFGYKSINITDPTQSKYWVEIPGEKRRVFFDYCILEFFKRVRNM